GERPPRQFEHQVVPEPRVQHAEDLPLAAFTERLDDEVLPDRWGGPGLGLEQSGIASRGERGGRRREIVPRLGSESEELHHLRDGTLVALGFGSRPGTVGGSVVSDGGVARSPRRWLTATRLGFRHVVIHWGSPLPRSNPRAASPAGLIVEFAVG